MQPKNIDEFFKRYKHRTFKKGKIFIYAGVNPQGIFYLADGLVKEYAISKNGEEVIINIFKPSTFFPMSWAISKINNKYFFEAFEDAKVYIAPVEDTYQFIKDNPEILLDLTRRLYKGLDGVNERMVHLMSEKAIDRLLVELIINVKRFGIKQKNFEHAYKLKILEKDIAAQTGLSRETISREINLLKKWGLIEFNNNILTVRDIRLLENKLVQT